MTGNNSDIGVGLVSVGWMGRLHSRAYQALPSVYPELGLRARLVHAADTAADRVAYARDILGYDNPRVGLLSVGEEEGKGNDLTREAYEELRESSLNFIGNVEGRDIYNGNCDVVVTDGFTGNVALKISESLADMLGAMVREELARDLRSRMGAALALPAFQRVRKRVDYTEMGGAPLLGIDGAAIICHGASPVKAIKNAVRVAAK